jgi:hypothetical protein
MQAIRPTAAGAHYSRIFTHTLGQVNVQKEDGNYPCPSSFQYDPKQLHEDNSGEECRAGHHQEKINTNAKRQASEDRRPTERQPKSDRLDCEQQDEKQRVLARQFNSHNSIVAGQRDSKQPARREILSYLL